MKLLIVVQVPGNNNLGDRQFKVYLILDATTGDKFFHGIWHEYDLTDALLNGTHRIMDGFVRTPCGKLNMPATTLNLP